jgi:CheY-like chemotaxis protein
MQTFTLNPRKPRVLVIDDEHIIADTLVIILKNKGYDATAVYSGKAAIEAAEQWRPDLVLSDVMLPDINGIDAAVCMAAFLPDSKFLFFSGNLSTEDLLSDYRSRGQMFEALAKPIHPTDLLAMFEAAVPGHLLGGAGLKPNVEPS